MRSFFTFLSMFTLLFFLIPLLCLSAPAKTRESQGVSLPESVKYDGRTYSTGDFLTGRLAAWGLKGYQPEALQAAAVVAATELCTVYEKQGTADGLSVLTAEQAKAEWGDYWFSRYWPELQSAVSDTWGKTLQGQDPAAVFPLSWGTTLSGVKCPYDETAEGFETEITVSQKEFAAVFPQFQSSLTVKKTQSNRVETVTSGQQALTGEEVASEFDLPSPSFSITVEDASVTFLCYGKGSGEGMSLYGANELAKRGADYEEILKTFFPDSRIIGQENRS